MRIMNMLTTWIMDFLSMLAAYGNELTPTCHENVWDFNNNGMVDVMDILQMLINQPPGNQGP